MRDEREALLQDFPQWGLVDATARMCGSANVYRVDCSQERDTNVRTEPTPKKPARRAAVRLRFCSHPAYHRLVKGLPGARCIYHVAGSNSDG